MSAFGCRVAGVLVVAITCRSALASEPSPTRDPQESDPNVGLFRLPAHPGEAGALAGPEGFGFLSSDNRFGMMLHPALQADARGELGTPAPGKPRSTFLVRFAGLALTARLYERLRYEMLVSFSQSQLTLSQAWLDADIAPWLHFKAGKLPVPISLERSTTSLFFPLIDADLPSGLLPTVDTGAEIWGRVGEVLEYSVAIVNGATAGSIGDSDVDSFKDVVGRVAVSPFELTGPGSVRGLTLGVGASGSNHVGSSTDPEVLSLSTWGGVKYFAYRSTIAATGSTLRLVPQASWHGGPFSAYVEVARTRDEIDHAAVTSMAWGAVATFVLTGERALPLHYVIPTKSLSPSRGQLGAFELVAGAGALDARDDGQLAARVDPKAAMRGARMMAGGINWYPNLGVRVMLDLEHTWFVPVASFPALPDETLLVGRFQVVL